MKRYNAVYRYIGIVNAAVHILLAVFLVIVAFLPFHEQRTFYQAFGGVLISLGYLLMPLAAAVLAWLAVKRPLLSLATLLLMGLFFVCIILPYLIEAMVVAFGSIGVAHTDMSRWQQGFTLMSGAADILLWDIAFGVYAIVTAIVRAVYKKREKENAYE